MILNYNGKELKTDHFEEISDEKFYQLKKEYYEKPSIDLVRKQILTIDNGGVMINHITNYFFKDLMAKTKLYTDKWSIEEVFESKELLGYFLAKTRLNDKVFTGTDIKNIETSLRLGGKGVASKPSNFEIKIADYFYKNYNTNNITYDYSCGWGVRLLSALKNNLNYFGTDPNYLLVDRLNILSKEYKTLTKKDKEVKIFALGSEILIEELVGRIGLAFSSPPYYNLEDYKIGNQSWNPKVTYGIWKQDYLFPTIKNIYKYLIENGFFIVNIKNFKNYNLEKDIIEISKLNGFSLFEIISKDFQKTPTVAKNSENFYVFKKEV